MKRVTNCIVENCIPTPSSCTIWNGGDIDYLGIKDGDQINTLLWEVVTKLQSITGESLKDFDIDGLLTICSQKAPLEVTLISILTLIRDNQVCLKDFIDTLNQKIIDFTTVEAINVDLKCYANFDNIGNSLQITRNELDQLVINNLCDHARRLTNIEGAIVDVRSEISNLELTRTVDELSFPTCLDAGVKPTSAQVKVTAQNLCDLQTAVGVPTSIATALSKTPSNFLQKFGTIQGWNNNPANLADSYGNLLLAFNNLLTRLEYMENNCCAISCDDVKVGFNAGLSDTNDSIIINFTSGAGTKIPTGWTDKGSTGTITDVDGNVESFTIAITNGGTVDIPISGLSLTGDLSIQINSSIGNGTTLCNKCIGKKVKPASCTFCTITATGSDTAASAIIIYDDGNIATHGSIVAG